MLTKETSNQYNIGNLIDQLFQETADSWHCADVDRSALVEALIGGGYPEMMQIRDGRGRYFWFSSYIRTYIERDVRDIGEIRNLDGFIRLHHLLAIRSGNVINKAELGN